MDVFIAVMWASQMNKFFFIAVVYPVMISKKCVRIKVCCVLLERELTSNMVCVKDRIISQNKISCIYECTQEVQEELIACFPLVGHKLHRKQCLQ
jgi:hypothetical protein